MVGVDRFELSTPCSQSRCASQAALYPDGKVCYPFHNLQDPKMKVAFLAIISFFLSPWALTAENWERCMDQGDFSFSTDSFVKSHRMAKSGCTMRFVELGGKGLKFELNLCDPNTHLDAYPAIDATTYTRHYAGSYGCPAPLFGADFESQPGTTAGYAQAKAKVLEIFQSIKKVYGPELKLEDASKITGSPKDNSQIKMACAELLFLEYIDRCTAFEGKPQTAPAKTEVLPPGVHPQTIKP